MGKSLLPLSILILLATGSALAAAPLGVEIKTEHYDLYCEGPNPEEYGRLLEQLYTQLKDFFGGAPEGRLRVKMLADASSYVAALKAAGVTDASDLEFSNGVYYTGLKVAFVKRRKSRWLTNADLIHECVHQFHCLTRTKDQGWPSSRYYSEGIAKYLEYRHWDGETLQSATAQMPYAENIQKALDRFRSIRKRQLRNILTDPGYRNPRDPKDMHYDEAYLFVRFLIEQAPKEFRTLSARLDQCDEPGAAWDDTIGRLPLDLNERYEKWIEGSIRPLSWEVATGVWVPRGDWLEGSVVDEKPDEKGNRSSAEMVLRARSDRVTLHVRHIGSEAEVGVFIAVLPEGPFWYVRVAPDGTLGVLSYDQTNKWAVKPAGKLERRLETLQFAVKRVENHWLVRVENGTEIPIPAPPEAHIGATVLGGRAEFRIENGS